MTGVAGGGVTTFLADTAAQALLDGADPQGILVVTPAKDSATRLRRAIDARLTRADGGRRGEVPPDENDPPRFVSAGALVRSVHSLAFSLLREEDPKVRLFSGAEQDGFIRELLAGHADYAAGSWPAEYHPALRMAGFARQLRDFLLRAAERGVTPDRLRDLGALYHRPIWRAAGDFFEEYSRVLELSGGHFLSASQLVTAALALLDRRGEAGETVAGRWHTVMVDDAQHLDPKSAELIERLADGAELVLVGGSPEQSVFHFRGADPRFLKHFPAEHEVRLDSSHRDARMSVITADTKATEHAAMTDRIRRSALVDGVNWSDIAVVVRSATELDPARRALLAAGIPVHIDATDVVLAEQPIVRGLLAGLRALGGGLTASEAEELALGPVGGADPVTLRRLLRGLRRLDFGTRASETLAALLGPDAVTEPMPVGLNEVLTERELSILGHLRGVLAAGRAAREDGGSVEEVLWALWSETGLADRLSAAALRGGASGSQADRDLDHTMALFDLAGDFTERSPGEGTETFVDFIAGQQIPSGMRDRSRVTPEAVTVATAHGTVGRQWRRVFLLGVQDDVWPAVGQTGTLFEQEQFVDLVDKGVEPDAIVGRGREKIAEERRLFAMVCHRATEETVIMAVDAPDADPPAQPSRFLRDIDRDLGITPVRSTVASGEVRAIPDSDSSDSASLKPASSPLKPLSVAATVARLRRAVCGQTAGRRSAARQLARLAAAGVPGANPREWWAATTPSSERPLRDTPRAAVSPSRIERLLACPLNAEAAPLVEPKDTTLAMARGLLVHGLLEALARGVDRDLAEREVTAAFERFLDGPAWHVELERSRWAKLLARATGWMAANAASFHTVGVEVPVCVELPEPAEGITVTGRIDRLVREREGRDHIIIDFKTARTPVSKAEAEAHPQLAAYQLALAHGRVVEAEGGAARIDTGSGIPLSHATLVYPGSDTADVTTREQAVKSEEELRGFAAALPGLVADARGPRLLARVNDGCGHCALRAVCPAVPEGRMTIDA